MLPDTEEFLAPQNPRAQTWELPLMEGLSGLTSKIESVLGLSCANNTCGGAVSLSKSVQTQAKSNALVSVCFTEFLQGSASWDLS